MRIKENILRGGLIFFVCAYIAFMPSEQSTQFIGTVEKNTETGFYVNAYLSCTEPCGVMKQSEFPKIFVKSNEFFQEGSKVKVSGVLRASITGKMLGQYILEPKSIEMIE